MSTKRPYRESERTLIIYAMKLSRLALLYVFMCLLLSACKKCWTEARADPEAATQALVKAERLTNPTIERERFEWVLQHQVFTEETTRLGLGNLDVARLQRGLDILDVTAGRAKGTPASAIWSAAYLPPA